MKKALMLASVATMIDCFNMDNIQILQKSCLVDVIANFDLGSHSSQERTEHFRKKLEMEQIGSYNIHIPRKIFDFKAIVEAYKSVKKICTQNNYCIVHCHSPIGGVIARMACTKLRKTGTKVIYTAHGFHFFKGAPKLFWLIYFPIEWISAFFTDVLITINTEDYKFAQKHMHAKKITYIHGVGIDLEKLSKTEVDKNKKRSELGIDENSFVILSVGELNQNKNHIAVIKALAELNEKDVHYVIAGTGELSEQYLELANKLGVNDRLHLIGYRNDVDEIYKIADAFVFPSYREGLSVSLMEAMACGLPCVVSKIRGNTDLIDDTKGGFLVEADDTIAFAEKIKELSYNKALCRQMGSYNMKKVEQFSKETVKQEMEKIYSEVLNYEQTENQHNSPRV